MQEILIGLTIVIVVVGFIQSIFMIKSYMRVMGNTPPPGSDFKRPRGSGVLILPEERIKLNRSLDENKNTGNDSVSFLDGSEFASLDKPQDLDNVQ